MCLVVLRCVTTSPRSHCGSPPAVGVGVDGRGVEGAGDVLALGVAVAVGDADATIEGVGVGRVVPEERGVEVAAQLASSPVAIAAETAFVITD